MKIYFIIINFIFLIIFNGCEELEITYPGNNQDLEPKPPKGSLIWAIDFDETSGNGKLKENSASGLTIGSLSATDPNPDDEFTYEVYSQKMNDVNVNYFVINSDSGLSNLELSNGNINFEDLSGSKQIDLIIRVTDDSLEPQTSDFSLTIEIINVNETPYFTNLSSIPVYADEYIDFNSNNIEWTDTDEGQNPELSSQGPGWLNISDEGLFQGQPSTENIGINSFLLTITDGEINVQEELNIEVRANSAPIFTNANSIPNSIRVGCYDDNETIYDFNWVDPNNNSVGFMGTDIVSFSHEGSEALEWLNFDNEDNGILFCVRKPENEDAGIFNVSVFLNDDRPNVPITTEFNFDLELIANDSPEFLNLSAFPESIAAGDTLQFNLDWQDSDDDIITFGIEENLSWFDWDNSGNITMNPNSNHTGTYEIIFSLSDGCYAPSLSRTLTVE
ncbi:MAG: cadherin repeat domain-containing protein [Candidatus Neomarinimicrobiota bacterium]